MGRSSKTACVLAFFVGTAAFAGTGFADPRSEPSASSTRSNRPASSVHRPVVVRGGSVGATAGGRSVRPTVNGAAAGRGRRAPLGDQVALGVFDGTGAFNSAGIIDQPDLLSNGFLNGLPIPPPREPVAPPFSGGPGLGFGGPFAAPPFDLGGRTASAPACPLIIKVGHGLKRTVPTKVIYGRRHCT